MLDPTHGRLLDDAVPVAGCCFHAAHLNIKATTAQARPSHDCALMIAGELRPEARVDSSYEQLSVCYASLHVA
jgi:hypothetical protein